VTISDKTTILAMIENHTHQTGTLAYGLPAADHDRFCTWETYDSLFDALTRCGVEIGPGGESGGTFKSMKFDLAGETFNVFIVDADEIEIVKAVTKMVAVAARAMPDQAKIKPLRVQLFQVLRDTLKMWKHMGGAA
jgi:hypothetical protein